MSRLGLLARAAATSVANVALVGAVATWLRGVVGLGPGFPPRAAAVVTVVSVAALRHLRRHHPHPELGTANVITGVRAGLTALVAAAAVEPLGDGAAWAIVAASILAEALDGVDGWAARRQGTASDFGARFDMEVDALLILALSVAVWQRGAAGAWVLLSGLMRYAFVAAGAVWPWFTRALPASRRRQTVCVVQIAALVLAVCPIVGRPWSAWLAAASLWLLTWSFGVDVAWLAARRRQPMAVATPEPSTMT